MRGKTGRQRAAPQIRSCVGASAPSNRPFMCHPPPRLASKLTLAVFVAVLATSATPVPGPVFAQATVDDEYRLGLGHYKQKRWPLAAEHLRAYIKARPKGSKVASARLLLGVSLTHLKKYTQARSELRRFVVDFPKDPNRPEALFRVAECSYLLEDWATATTGLKTYLKDSPKHPLRDWGQFYLGDALVQQKKFTEARAIYRSSLAEFPKGSLVNEIRFGLGVCCERGGQTDEARKIYNRLAADKTSRHADKALSQLGSLEFNAGRFAEAAAAWNRLARTYPKSPEAPAAQLNAGYAHFQLKQYAEAITSFQSARLRSDQAAEADYWRGVSLKALDRTDEAIRAFGQAETGKPGTDLARDIQFQWADTEFRAGRYSQAATRFQNVVTRWPKHPEADQGLLFATESMLLATENLSEPAPRQRALAQVQKLIDRFEREYPRSQLTTRHRLQAGRLKVARGGNTNLKDAQTLFRTAIAQGGSETIRNRARYQLARVGSRLGNDRMVLDTLRPILAAIKDSNRPGEFDDALVLAASSFLASKQHKPAAESAAKYLKKPPRGPLSPDALAVLAESKQRQGQVAGSDLALTQLANLSGTKPIYAQTVRRMAESSYAEKNFQRSDRLFGNLVALGPRSPFHAAGLSGRGWSLFESKKYAEAAAIFGRVVVLHPKDKLAAEAAYKAAECFEKADEPEKAAEAYRVATKSYPNSSFAFLAARRAARLLALDKKTPQADAAYAALLKQFPKAKDRDGLIFEWAGMHADADDFKKADVLYRQLIREYPRSRHVTAARFSLAESDLLAGRLVQARTAFLQVARSQAGDDEVRQDALFRLVGIATEAKQWEQVREHGKALRTRFPKSRHSWEVRFQLGQAALHLRDYPTAQAELAAVLGQTRNEQVAGASWFDEAWVLLAETRFRTRDYEGLVRTVNDFRRTRPGSKVLYKADEVLGRGMLKKPRPDFTAAREAFGRVISSAEGRKTKTAARSHLQMADSFYIQKNFREAKKQFLAVEILYNFPDIQSPALFQAAACQEQLREFAEAVKTLDMLIRKHPDSSFAAMAKKRLPRLRRLAGS